MDDDILRLGLVDDDEIMLDLSALDLAALDHPGIDLDPYLERLDTIEARLAARDHEAETDEERAQLLLRVMVQECGFTGDRETYDDPANADLIQVLDRRRGLPVSLAILYVAMARRLGWEAVALNTPGHVIVRLGPEDDPVIIDPFSGSVLEPNHVWMLVAHARWHGQHVISHRLPMSNRTTLVRLLLNQAMRAEDGGEAARALSLYERITLVDPADANGLWQRARLELAEGDVAAARASLGAMLEITRDPALRLQVTAALDQLTGSAD